MNKEFFTQTVRGNTKIIEWFYLTHEIVTKLSDTIRLEFYCFLLFSFDYYALIV